MGGGLNWERLVGGQAFGGWRVRFRFCLDGWLMFCFSVRSKLTKMPMFRQI